MKINYQSDFDFIYRPRDLRGEPVDFPPQGVDWRVEFHTRDHCRPLTVQCTGGVCMNCFNDNGRIHVIAKDHGLSPGRLVGTMTLLNPNGIYPGGIQRIVDRQPVGIELVTGCAAHCGTPPEVDVTLPVVAASIKVCGHVELVTDAAVYRVPVTPTPAERIPLADEQQ